MFDGIKARDQYLDQLIYNKKSFLDENDYDG